MFVYKVYANIKITIERRIEFILKVMDMNLIIGIMIPFVGTTLGSAMVFFMKDKLNDRLEKILLGFAAGVMIAASIWSLLIPAMEHSVEHGGSEWFPAASGFLIGIFFLLALDMLIPHLHLHADEPEGIAKKGLSKTLMFFLAVTLHNIPEGMAVGVAFASVIAGNTGMTIAAAISLAIGIAIQNFPEGAIVSMPLKSSGISKGKAFLYGFFSGIVEPIAAFVTILLTSKISLILPYLLAFAAGSMIYVVADELIPKSQSGELTKLGIIGLTIGFLIMMVLDITLG